MSLNTEYRAGISYHLMFIVNIDQKKGIIQYSNDHKCPGHYNKINNNFLACYTTTDSLQTVN